MNPNHASIRELCLSYREWVPDGGDLHQQLWGSRLFAHLVQGLVRLGFSSSVVRLRNFGLELSALWRMPLSFSPNLLCHDPLLRAYHLGSKQFPARSR